MKVAILGSGRIGAGLARAWTKAGHEVVLGARDPRDPELSSLCAQLGAEAATLEQAPAGADVVVLAVPYGVLSEVLAKTGPLEGQVVIDCTNAVERGMAGLKYGHTTSSAEELQKQLPKAKVFKSFNAQGAENLSNPVYGGVKATNFFCGDDVAGKALVKQLVEDVGFEAIDAGPLSRARLLEPLMLLWIHTAQALGTRDLAFKVLRR